ncbi:MAG: AhpC/TSA family protein [Planctomycetota bacterium]
MAASAADGFPSLLFFHPASVEAGAEFFGQRAPSVRAAADPDHVYYTAFGLRRGSWRQLAGLAVWLRGALAFARGHGVGRPSGNPLLMPGAFLIRGRQVVWSHRSRHAGDHPDLAVVRRQAAAASGSPAPS